MKQTLIFAAILGFAACGRLEHLYLPANQGSSSSGAFGASAGGSYNAQSYSSNGNNQIPIVKFSSDNNGEGSYGYNYETGNGISAQESGEAHGQGTNAHGSFSYTSPEGEHVSITYTADGNGFAPQGSHIPTPPPIPEAILKSIQENAAAAARGEVNEGSYRGEGLSEGQYKGEGQAARTNGGGSFNGYNY